MAIRCHPEDFQVTEELEAGRPVESPPHSGPRYALYQLKKNGIPTPQAAAELARSLELPRSAVAYAGLKDRHAVTTQHMTAAWAADAPPPAAVRGRNWQAEPLGYCDQAIQSDQIHRNHFQIVVRDLTRRAAEEMAYSTRVLHWPGADRTLGIVNYFGDQRFGSARGNKGFAAPLLLRGDYEGALKLLIATPDRKDQRRLKDFKKSLAAGWGQWEQLAQNLPEHPFRPAVEHLAGNPADFCGAFAALPYFEQQMCVESYQSWLWNKIAAELVRHAGSDGPAGILERSDPFGLFLFSPPGQMNEHLKSLALPLPGPQMEWQEPWTEAALHILQAEGFSAGDLKLPGLRRPWFGSPPRPLVVQAENFHLGTPQPDPLHAGRRCLKLAFSLPRGSYATVVLRALGH